MSDPLASPPVLYTEPVRSWKLHFDGRTWTTNEERRLSPFDRAARVREWREAFFVLAKAQRIPALAAAEVTAQPFQRLGRIGDIGSVWPTIKAAIDGALVDSHVLPDDDPSHLIEVRLRPAMRGTTGLELTITESQRKEG